MRSHYLILFTRQHQLNKTCCLTLSLCAVNFSPGELDDAYVLVLLLRLARGQSHACRLRVREGTPGYDTIIHLFLSHRHKRVAYRNPCLIGSYMGEEVAAGDIPDRQNIRCRGLEIRIDLDTFIIIVDTRRLQIQPLNVGMATCSQDY